MSKYNVQCDTIQGMFRLVYGRVGICRDENGRHFIDVGVGLGAGVYASYLPTREDRDVFDVSAQGTLAAFGSAQVSTLGSSSSDGVGFPLGGASVNANLLIPPLEDWLFPRHPRREEK